MPFSISLFALQWAVGGLLFLWVTTRHRIVGLGYGQISRVVFLVLIAISYLLSGSQTNAFRVLCAVVGLATLAAVVSSHLRRKAGVSGANQIAEARSQRVAEMTGFDLAEKDKDAAGDEFNPIFDLFAAGLGLLGLIVLGFTEESILTTARILIGTLFLGVISDAMALGHWYLVQPGLGRKPLVELVKFATLLWLPISLIYLLPTGMISVFTGAIDDGYGGILGWFWAASAITTGGLLAMTTIALKEKQYSAVMAATGLLYLAILTAFSIDLVARALLI